MSASLAPRHVLTLSLTLLGACGEDGTRASASAGQSDGTTAAGPVTEGSTSAATGSTGEAPTTTAGSASDSDSPTTTAGATVGTTSGTSTGEPPDPSTGEPGTSTGDNTTGAVDPCAGGMGDFDFSYLWVANTSQGSVSKIITLKAANCGVYSGLQAVA
jgi:hypothetical protein